MRSARHRAIAGILKPLIPVVIIERMEPVLWVLVKNNNSLLTIGGDCATLGSNCTYLIFSESI